MPLQDDEDKIVDVEMGRLHTVILEKQNVSLGNVKQKTRD